MLGPQPACVGQDTGELLLDGGGLPGGDRPGGDRPGRGPQAAQLRGPGFQVRGPPLPPAQLRAVAGQRRGRPPVRPGDPVEVRRQRCDPAPEAVTGLAGPPAGVQPGDRGPGVRGDRPHSLERLRRGSQRGGIAGRRVEPQRRKSRPRIKGNKHAADGKGSEPVATTPGPICG